MMDYDFSTAEAIRNDNGEDTWDVRARGSDGNWWTVSDSAIMHQEDAELTAAEMRSGITQDK